MARQNIQLSFAQIAIPKSLIAGLLLTLGLSGCARITFVNGEQVAEEPGMTELDLFGTKTDSAPSGVEVKTKWHHQLIYQVAEFSNAADTEKLCPDTEWNRVTTEVSTVPMLVGLIDNLVTSPAIDMWTPWDLEYSCKP